MRKIYISLLSYCTLSQTLEKYTPGRERRSEMRMVAFPFSPQHEIGILYEEMC